MGDRPAVYISGWHKLVDGAIPYGIAALHGRVNSPLLKKSTVAAVLAKGMRESNVKNQSSNRE